MLSDLLSAYANLSTGQAPEAGLPPRDAAVLADRYRFPLRHLGWRRRLTDMSVGVREAVKFALRRPTPLAARGDANFADAGPAVLARRLTGEETAVVRRAAAASGATVNELAIFAALGAIDDWNSTQSAAAPTALYRLLVPCDLRTAAHAATPAANVMAYSFYTRRAVDCREPAALLAGVRAESTYIRDRNASLYFVRCLEAASRLPGGVRSMSSAEGCYATLLLSNTGDPWRRLPAPLHRRDGRVAAGDVLIDDIRGFSPLRPGTRAGLVLATYQGRLSLGLRFDPESLDRPAAESFLSRFCQRLVKPPGGNLNGT